MRTRTHLESTLPFMNRFSSIFWQIFPIYEDFPQILSIFLKFMNELITFNPVLKSHNPGYCKLSQMTKVDQWVRGTKTCPISFSQSCLFIVKWREEAYLKMIRCPELFSHWEWIHKTRSVRLTKYCSAIEHYSVISRNWTGFTLV